jgi:transposase-like protein
MEVYHIVEEEMNHLPTSEWITLKYSKRKGDILNIDGKFIKVRGYEKKIPFIYTIDYFKHDIPFGLLSTGETYEAYLKLFQTLKDIGYSPRVVVSDEAPALPLALERVFPKAKQQLCLTHYVENIRVLLRLRTQFTYRSFFNELNCIFKREISLKHRLFVLDALKEKYANDNLAQSVVLDIYDKYEKLFLFDVLINCPHSNNIIEAFNSHLNGRLKTIKGFKSFRGAARWLNAWMVRRRTKPFTDCAGQFKYLNGRCSLEEVIDEKEKYEDVYQGIMQKVNDLDKRQWKKKRPK